MVSFDNFDTIQFFDGKLRSSRFSMGAKPEPRNVNNTVDLSITWVLQLTLTYEFFYYFSSKIVNILKNSSYLKNKAPAKHRNIFLLLRLHQLSHSYFGRGNRN